MEAPLFGQKANTEAYSVEYLFCKDFVVEDAA